MANYIKLAGKAVAELFDGTQATAESLVTAYPDTISIQSPSVTYPELTGDVTVDPAETGVVATVDVVKEDVYTPYEITVTVTDGASATGDVTITFFEEDPIIVGVTLGDNALTVAAAIAGATFTGFTAVDNMDGTITITQDLADDGSAVLNVVRTDGSIQNAYKDNYVAFIDEMASSFAEVSKVEVWAKADFEKYFVADGN